MSAAPQIRRRDAPVGQVQWPADMPPILQRIYAGRGVTDSAQLDLGMQALESFSALRNIDAAARLLHQAIESQQHILIVGDFDADGATATALAVHALRRMGAEKTSYIVPDRFLHGYGLTPEIVALAQQQAPELIITVDNGISSLAGVEKARNAGVRVLVTDHHLPGEQLPRANAIVNPNQPGCGFASRNLAGVGVIFYVLCALRALLRKNGWFASRSEPSMADYLDLVAVGTVADVVPMDHNNRVLVAQGLQRIRAGHARPGLRALAQVAGRDCAQLVSADIGFGIAPRLNAAGRMQDMRVGIACLLADDEAAALASARELNEINSRRRERQTEMEETALAAVAAAKPDESQALPAGLCLHRSDWHEGIVGLVAGKLRERHFRPVVAFANTANQPESLKGSARSIPGVHIRDVFAAIDTAYPGLIERFGGHAMAAGLSLAAANLQQFSQAFVDEVSLRIAPEQMQNIVLTDGELDPDEFTLTNASLLRDAAPWGQLFEAPCFDGEFLVKHQKIVGERHLKLRLRPVSGEQLVEAIFFGHDQFLAADRPVRLVYRMDVNEYQGLRSLQLIIIHVMDQVLESSEQTGN